MMETVRRRGQFQIVFELLRNMRQPVKKTRLRVLTRISGVGKYLSWLMELGLVKDVPYVSDRGRSLSKATPYLYVVTEKGKELIRLYERIYDILGWRLKDE